VLPLASVAQIMAASAVDDRMSWLVCEVTRARFARLNGTLARAVDCAEPWLADIGRHLIDAGGKQLRPALLMVSAGFGSGALDEEALQQAAAAIELLHIATLYHDDVMDRSPLRRGVPTLNARYGDATAVTAGTFLLARATILLAGLGDELAQWLARGALSLALGQLLETENAYNTEHQVDAYLRIAARKTAALFELPCRVGALLSCASDEVTQALAVYGRALGMAFQAADDALDISATTGRLGKMTGTDLREGVYGLPVLLALSQGGVVAAELREILERDEPDETDAARACRLLQDSGAVPAALRIAQDYSRRAAEAAYQLPPGAPRSSLMYLTRYAVSRTS